MLCPPSLYGWRVRWATRSDILKFDEFIRLEARTAWIAIAVLDGEGVTVDAVVLLRGSNDRVWIAGPLGRRISVEITAVLFRRLIDFVAGLDGSAVHVSVDDTTSHDREMLAGLGFRSDQALGEPDVWVRRPDPAGEVVD